MIKAVVVVIKNDEFEYLVLKRHKNHKFSEQWCLPGGKVDFLIDQNRWELEEEAAFRELKEETGLKPLYLYKDKKHSYSDGNFIIRAFFGDASDMNIDDMIDFPTREHSDFKWCKRDDESLPELTKTILDTVEEF